VIPSGATDVILFDGVCNLCNGFVLFVIDRDPKKKFSFASMQSEFAQRNLEALGRDLRNFDSVVLLSRGKVYLRSSAVLQVVRRLNWPWRFAAIFLICPTWLRDFAYKLVAKNRYRLFGKLNACRLPTPELRSRFLG
jgi:predicted DCC family thiol-disulfide oxidoreductase YuxK